jgi:hypothetical protein
MTNNPKYKVSQIECYLQKKRLPLDDGLGYDWKPYSDCEMSLIFIYIHILSLKEDVVERKEINAHF